MTVFVCIDERGGMIFNKRRQSRDKILIENVAELASDGILFISEYSEELFSESNASVIVVSNPLESAPQGSYAFIETPPLRGYTEKVSKLVIYKWNERYPYDKKLDISPEDEGFRLSESSDFQGNAHDRITREIYVK